MNTHHKSDTYRIDLAYAKHNNHLFGERIYHPKAQLWLHKTLADITLKAAEECLKNHALRFILYDGLRTVDAQNAMMKTRRVKDNPHWMDPPRLLSPPGSGGHPRAMAIDIGLETLGGALVEMGTVFDFLADNPHPDHNPAHRHFNHAPLIQKNRNILDTCMIQAAKSLRTPLLALPQEWWDFRLLPEFYEQYEPLCDHDLPVAMRLMR